jgi:hypothetical protein
MPCCLHEPVQVRLLVGTAGDVGSSAGNDALNRGASGSMSSADMAHLRQGGQHMEGDVARQQASSSAGHQPDDAEDAPSPTRPGEHS